MNDERLYSVFTRTGHSWTTTAGGIKNCWPCMNCPYPTMKIRKILLLTHPIEGMPMN